MKILLLEGTLALAEPKAPRYPPLHVPAWITRRARQTQLHIAEHWPWAKRLATDVPAAHDPKEARKNPATAVALRPADRTAVGSVVQGVPVVPKRDQDSTSRTRISRPSATVDVNTGSRSRHIR
jgi:hypothetical protein